MTSRAGKPDTEADIKLRACLDARRLTSFIMVAGAGSGKTTSLVKALAHVAKTRGESLKRHGQKVACITYTEVAEKEIWTDVGESPLFHVSTIHSFLWTVIRPFQNDIREWVSGRIDEKIAEAQARLDNHRTKTNTRERAQQDIERLKAQRGKLPNIVRFTYGTGADYQNGILGHDDIIKMVPDLIITHPLLRLLVAQRFPFIFVDESQDTVEDVVRALKSVDSDARGQFCLGFFGDPMQKIYVTGVGRIVEEPGWISIQKPENFRCSPKVLTIINKIRAAGDGLVQTRGHSEEGDGASEPAEGTARLFILPADNFRSERLQAVRRWLAAKNDDPYWLGNDNGASVRILVVVHRMAAKRLGFAELYAALNDNNPPPSLRNGFLDGTAWAVAPFLSYILLLVQASNDGRQFDLMALLRQKCPLLGKARLLGVDPVEALQRIKDNVNHLVSLLAKDGSASIADVLRFVQKHELANLDDRLSGSLAEFDASEVEVKEAFSDEVTSSENQAMAAFFNTPAKQLWGYRSYIENESPFSTQQGIKGAEFKRVLTILDDDDGSHVQFSYNKYFGLVAPSDADKKNAAEGKETTIDRTRRLFYVSCSRAVQDLAVVLYASDVARARERVAASGIFLPDQIHVFTDGVAEQA